MGAALLSRLAHFWCGADKVKVGFFEGPRERGQMRDARARRDADVANILGRSALDGEAVAMRVDGEPLVFEGGLGQLKVR